MNRLFYALAALLLASSAAFAQILQPVTWSTSVRTLDAGKLELVATAKIDAGWHVYSQFIGADGPIPTAFTLPASKDLKTEGPVREPKPIKEFDKNFGMELAYFAKKGGLRLHGQANQQRRLHVHRRSRVHGLRRRALPPAGLREFGV